MRGGLLLAGIGLAGLSAPALADTLREALLKAYQTSPTLTAARAGVRALDEDVPIARSAGRPQVSLNAGYVENALNLGGANSLSSPDRQASTNTQLTVPVLTGGLVRGQIRGAETRVDAGRAQLRGTESDLFTSVVGAYMDVIRDEAIVGLNMQNMKVLEVNLQATRDRFQVGDLTRTDVAQSEARLSVARSQLQTAQAQLITSREDYVRLVGSPPGSLETPPALPGLPTSPELAVDTALKSNPTLLAARRAADATVYDIDVARAGRRPRVNVVIGGNYYNYLGSFGAGTSIPVGGQAGTSGTVGVALNMPLFQGGLTSAQIRQAQARRAQSLEQSTDIERQIIANTRAAYAIWKSSQEVIASSEDAVSANKLSLEGVRAENTVGNRTILDILNAEQELLNTQVQLVTARRDAYVAGFALLAAMGEAEARDLGLEGGALYDPLTNYNRVRNKWSDWDKPKNPQPEAPSTAGTPPQTSTVTKPLDPEFDQPVDSALPGGPGTLTRP